MRILSRLQRIDERVYDRMTAIGLPVLDPHIPRFVQATDNMAPWILMTAALATTGDPRQRRTALRAFIAASAANALSSGIKLVITRSRPDSSRVPAARMPYVSYPSSSFPSGHTAAAAAFAGGVVADAPRPLSTLVAAIAGAVAVSRVHSGVHYPGDVLGGIAIGTCTAMAARAVLPPRPELVHGARTAPDRGADPHDRGAGTTVVLNPRAAAGATSSRAADQVADALPRARIVHLSEEDEVSAVMDEAARDCEVLAVVGGDGTANAGARAALDHDRPLLLLPGGTLNNFARTLGLTSVEASLRAYADGHVARVDVGEVDGRIFLNTASFGSYPRMVERRERWAGRLGKWPAFALAMWWDLRTVQPTPAVVDGRATRVWWAFIGNCRYRTHTRLPALRERLDDGRLDVRILDAREPFPRLRATVDVLLGRYYRHWGGGYSERLATELTLSLPLGPRLLAVDGEVVEGAPTARFTKRRAALRMFVPAGSPDTGKS